METKAIDSWWYTGLLLDDANSHGEDSSDIDYIKILDRIEAGMVQQAFLTGTPIDPYPTLRALGRQLDWHEQYNRERHREPHERMYYYIYRKGS